MKIRRPVTARVVGNSFEEGIVRAIGPARRRILLFIPEH
jgi:hypothetical protein